MPAAPTFFAGSQAYAVSRLRMPDILVNTAKAIGDGQGAVAGSSHAETSALPIGRGRVDG
jgi:pyrimidine deaminase RibD-like protein